MEPTKNQYKARKGMFLWEGNAPVPVTSGDIINFVIPAILQKVVSVDSLTTTDNGDGTFTHTFDFTKGRQTDGKLL